MSGILVGGALPGAPSPLLPLFGSWLVAAERSHCQVDGDALRFLSSRLGPSQTAPISALSELRNRYNMDYHEIMNRTMGAACVAILADRTGRRALDARPYQLQCPWYPCGDSADALR
eukprot:9495168-Pyramimonas_sp.AAC.2